MRKRISLVWMMLMILCAALVPVSSARALELSTGIINADDVALRKSADSSGGVVTRLDEGAVVKILESNVNAEWYYVEAGTRKGYVNRIYVDIDASLPSYQLDYTGTIFKLTPPPTGLGRWTVTTLHRFTTSAGGKYPVGRLAFGTQQGDVRH